MALFVAVAKAGSFSNAALELGLPLSTVSRRIGDLERKFGAKLLERTTRKLRLTAFGRLVLDRSEAPIEALAEAVRLRMPAGGAIRATAPPLAARGRLGDDLLAFLGEHPGISLDLTTTNSPLDFIRDNIDIAFRVGPLDDSSLVAVRLWDIPYVICAGGALADDLREKGEAVSLSTLNMLPTIYTGQPWRFAGMAPIRPSNVVHRIDDLEVAAAGVRVGLGLAYLPRDLALGAGVEVPLEGLLPLDKALFAVFLERRLLPAHLRSLIEWLKGRAQLA
ncbi:LysR family transcriptional regulator [Nitratireductor luteus]|uniref:LysR family transcriptional regulator n=1 Tax=Nitratireductor luteus TaxID=2976980 RepID=UPI0022409E4E|nr:LysR family transcriptional regulator [Nitratireductor luteus]